MPINKSTEYGNIEISLDAIANLAGGAITECYGIETRLVLNLYIIALQGIKLNQVVYEAQKRVKYVLEKTLEVKCNAVNIYVQGVRAVK